MCCLIFVTKEVPRGWGNQVGIGVGLSGGSDGGWD